MSRIYFHVLESVCPDNNTKNIFIGRLVRSLSLYVSTPPQGEKLLDDFSLSPTRHLHSISSITSVKT